MIKIIGDSPEELAVLQAYMETGILSNGGQELETLELKDYSDIEVVYSLSTNNEVLFNRYNCIVGELEKRNNTFRLIGVYNTLLTYEKYYKNMKYMKYEGENNDNES